MPSHFVWVATEVRGTAGGVATRGRTGQDAVARRRHSHRLSILQVARAEKAQAAQVLQDEGARHSFWTQTIRLAGCPTALPRYQSLQQQFTEVTGTRLADSLVQPDTDAVIHGCVLLGPPVQWTGPHPQPSGGCSFPV